MIDTSKYPDPSGYVEHDQYYRPLKERGRARKKENSVVELTAKFANRNVLGLINEILENLDAREQRHEDRRRVHDLNNKAAILRGYGEMLKAAGFDGTLGELKDRPDLISSYLAILRALSFFE